VCRVDLLIRDVLDLFKSAPPLDRVSLHAILDELPA